MKLLIFEHCKIYEKTWLGSIFFDYDVIITTNMFEAKLGFSGLLESKHK